MNAAAAAIADDEVQLAGGLTVPAARAAPAVPAVGPAARAAGPAASDAVLDRAQTGARAALRAAAPRRVRFASAALWKGAARLAPLAAAIDHRPVDHVPRTEAGAEVPVAAAGAVAAVAVVGAAARAAVAAVVLAATVVAAAAAVAPSATPRAGRSPDRRRPRGAILLR